MRKLVLGLAILWYAIPVLAQDDATKNVAIRSSKRLFRYEKGDRDNPLVVKEESRTLYYCRNYRDDVSVVEFYNDVETIDEVKILVDDSKKHDIRPRYDYYNSDGIFYSDAHVCYFSLPLIKKGATSEVYFEKTTRDPKYFTNIFLLNSEETETQEVKIIVPEWVNAEVKELNFKGYKIRREVTNEKGNTVYTYTMEQLPAMMSERSAPGPTYYAPHLLVLTKTATIKDEQLTYFNTVKDQYAWYRKLVLQIGNEQAPVKERATEIVKGLTTDEQKVKAIYQWVQDNIRYIAFENGIAGFKPEKAQEVLRKKYGDCKGMANLTTELLRSIGLDARLCWIGTKHIAYDYSTPSLAVDNHMISAWMNKGKPVFLDATEKFSGLGNYAERIQGKQVLIEDGEKYLLEKVPVATAAQNISTESRKLSIDGNNLKGHVVQVWKGESKEWMLTNLHNIKQDKQENALRQYLSEGKANFEISNLKIINIDDYHTDLKVEYDLLWKDALSTFDKESYLDLDNRKLLNEFTVDTAKRKLAYWFHFKQNNLFETELVLPPGKVPAELPKPLIIKKPGYVLSAQYSFNAGKLTYRNEVNLLDVEIKPEYFSQWNRDIELLTNFYNQQLVLNTK